MVPGEIYLAHKDELCDAKEPPSYQENVLKGSRPLRWAPWYPERFDTTVIKRASASTQSRSVPESQYLDNDLCALDNNPTGGGHWYQTRGALKTQPNPRQSCILTRVSPSLSHLIRAT